LVSTSRTIAVASGLKKPLPFASRMGVTWSELGFLALVGVEWAVPFVGDCLVGMVKRSYQ
jgi:hypothetical protein